MSKILVTGGLGYIGSNLVTRLIRNGHEVKVIDDNSNSHPSVVPTIEYLTNETLDIELGTLGKDEFSGLGKIEYVFHLAGHKSVGESVSNPLKYYQGNISATTALLQALNPAVLKKFIFSSTAAVYGDVFEEKIKEYSMVYPTNPYASSKLMCENIIGDWCKTNGTKATILRYFNPVGAGVDCMLGDDGLIATNLFPVIGLYLLGRNEKVRIFGDDYETPDGTGVRDYIDIDDLIDAHIQSMGTGFYKFLDVDVLNIGVGKGYSVLEVIRAFENVYGEKINVEFQDRRPGDVSSLICDPSKSEKHIGFKASRDLEKSVRTYIKFLENVYSL
ncbi:UDP-glucose 4-epimerase [Agrobacterium phage OLIVR5]|uniref:UDP-glucose 4-epimerase n=1 Tax=Agrobacterium phage OLIVR5 TaxID=2723773 RepID=A0A858MT15_9CAUD|nr:nucleotide-sugar epimerase [Agrobacterium phage OLIVR5]QIW87739.1 UDP-glucose 4-epimerase [Agrobacterium phage OLIVR5]QIW88001.1 UDP-glucose 4-epimerase [Agrobacterium phage OLIVR6]